MAKTQQSDLVGEILAQVQVAQTGPATWFTRLPANVQQELDGLRQEWLAGNVPYQKRSLARSVIEACRKRGLPVCGIQGVEDWLTGGRHR